MQHLRVDSDRLWQMIHETAWFGGTETGGIRRLTLSPEDKQVRDWLQSACEAAGCDVQIDQLGTMFAIRPGHDMSRPPIGFGSHLDTQPTGGKFDGVLGTLAALEVIRTLNDNSIETEVPLCLINWTNEEGSRFAPATMASAAFAGQYQAKDILERRDADGVSVAEALAAIGYNGAEPVGQPKLGAFVELHIEQGPILETEKKPIGIVEHGQGMIWYNGAIEGVPSHAGTTPMSMRRDGLLALSEMALAIEIAALRHSPHAVGTVGEVAIEHPSRNVVPGRVTFTDEFRSPTVSTLDKLDAELRKVAADISFRRAVPIKIDQLWRKEPNEFDVHIVEIIATVTNSLGYPNRKDDHGRCARRLQLIKRDSDRNDLRALQRWSQPQRVGICKSSRLHSRRQCSTPHRAAPRHKDRSKAIGHCGLIDRGMCDSNQKGNHLL